MRDANGRYRHKNIPESWVRYSELGHRVGKTQFTVTAWVRNGYLRAHRIGKLSYIDWNEAMQSRLFRSVYDRFQDQLAMEEDQDLPIPLKAKDPTFFEPVYA